MKDSITHPSESNLDSQQSVQLLYQNWLATVGTRNPEKVLKLYAEEAVLWGTLATKTKVGREQIRSYFDWFLDRASLAATSLESEFRQLSPDIAVGNGSYEFALGGKSADDPVVRTNARFTFVFQRNSSSGEWKIVEHHSSQFPAEATSMETCSKSD